MGAYGVVVLSSLLDDDSGFLEAVEGFSIEQFIKQFFVQALFLAVFPGASGFDEQSPSAELL